GRRQPAEFDREQENQHDAEPEVRRRDAPERKQVGAIVPGGALLHGRHDAGGNADQEGDDDRPRSQLQGYRQLLRDQLAYWPLDRQGRAEGAGTPPPDPMGVLHWQGLVEPVLLAYLLDYGRIALLARHHQRRIAGQELLQREDQHRHEEERRHELGDAT